MPFGNHLGYPITFCPIHGEMSTMEMAKVALLKTQPAYQKTSSRKPAIHAALMTIHQAVLQKSLAIAFRGFVAYKVV